MKNYNSIIETKNDEMILYGCDFITVKLCKHTKIQFSNVPP